jgi:hypothetical protein
MEIALRAKWYLDKNLAILETSDGSHFGDLQVTDWCPNGSRERGFAWVLSYLDDSSDPPKFMQREVEFPAEDASTTERQIALVKAATQAIDREPPALLVTEPERAPMAADEWTSLLDTQIFAWDRARGRLADACATDEDWAPQLVYVALLETLAWTYTLDNSLKWCWMALTDETKEALSIEVDRRIEKLLASDRSDLDEEAVHSSRLLEGYKFRLRDHKPYRRWCDLSRTGSFNRETSHAIKWIRGQMTHTAVSTPVHLSQFRSGAEPRWKWAHAAEFKRTPEDNDGEIAFNQELAGKDVLGIFSHFLNDFSDARLELAQALRREEARELAERTEG